MSGHDAPSKTSINSRSKFQKITSRIKEILELELLKKPKEGIHYLQTAFLGSQKWEKSPAEPSLESKRAFQTLTWTTLGVEPPGHPKSNRFPANQKHGKINDFLPPQALLRLKTLLLTRVKYPTLLPLLGTFATTSQTKEEWSERPKLFYPVFREFTYLPQFTDPKRAFLGSSQQRRSAHAVHGVDLGAVLDQQICHLQMTSKGFPGKGPNGSKEYKTQWFLQIVHVSPPNGFLINWTMDVNFLATRCVSNVCWMSPPCLVASMRGVSPICPLESTCAPCWRRSLATSKCPAPGAASNAFGSCLLATLVSFFFLLVHARK